ncbi:MAG: rhodanese-like domain-containing protein [Corynebacterium sp.]|nr:rhodanese-like domain-containing protein [Corynebacterium sp.]
MTIREVNPKDVPAEAIIIDVREPEEFAEVAAANARLVPLATVPENLDVFSREEDNYIICRSGARSARAVEYLEAQGIPAINIAGGTLAWVDAELPTA